MNWDRLQRAAQTVVLVVLYLLAAAVIVGFWAVVTSGGLP